MLDRLGVRYEPATRRGIETAVRVHDRIIGGIEYRSYTKKPLVLDCSLVVSLAVAGRFLHAHGVERVTYSSAYQRRKVRGTSSWSKHSFGLAIDIHTFDGVAPGTLQIRNDYEQGLGDVVDCVGTPLTRGGAILRTLSCQLSRSELFYMVLTPDYDAAHYNHFHIEARPWDERADLDALRAPPASDPDAGDSAEESGLGVDHGSEQQPRLSR